MQEMIDPDWAWSEFQPSPETPWDLRAAAHLHRRAGLGASFEQLTSAVADSPAAAVDRLLSAAESDSLRQEADLLAASALATGNVQQLSAWWTWVMLNTPAPALEKMTLFWHGHFATSAEKVQDGELMLRQNRLLRRFAFGDFSGLLLEISRDPAMLIYLDSATNRKAHPNENYAREIMELFCLGEGHYSETDIRELARCFTGWEIRRNEFRFNRYQHDSGSKSILGESGEFGGEDGVRIVVSQNAAPEFLAGKLIRFFVMDEPAPSEALIAPLARELREGGMIIRPVVRRILTSQLFFSKYAMARKVRSPVDLVIGLLRCLDGSANTFELATAVRSIGQGLFFPPSVKGWDGGRTWINSSTLLGRSNLVRSLISDEHTRFGRESLRDHFAHQGLTSAESILDRLETLLFAVPVPVPAREQIAQLMTPKTNAALTEGLQAFCTLPEFQLC